VSDGLQGKVQQFLQALDRKYGRPKPPAFLPPPASADLDAALETATRNAELVAGVVLGLHGPPAEGLQAARRLMSIFVDWNEVRVARRESLLEVMGPETPRSGERAALFQRFLEAFFLSQRNMNLESLVGMKPPERKQFVADLNVFNRDELPALLLSGFLHPNFPPEAALHRVAVRCGLIRSKTTVLQMAKLFETAMDAEKLLPLYAHLHTLAAKHCREERADCAHCPLKPHCPTAGRSGGAK
jgi:hypothetical protein